MFGLFRLRNNYLNTGATEERCIVILTNLTKIFSKGRINYRYSDPSFKDQQEGSSGRRWKTIVSKKLSFRSVLQRDTSDESKFLLNNEFRIFDVASPIGLLIMLTF